MSNDSHRRAMTNTKRSLSWNKKHALSRKLSALQRVQLIKHQKPMPGFLPITAAASALGGAENFMVFYRIAAEREPKLAPVLKAWDATTKLERKRAPLDEMMSAVPISPHDVVGMVVAEMSRYHYSVSEGIVAMNHRAVTETMMKQAKTVKGIDDRKMVMQHSGFLPMPKGTEVNVLQGVRLETGREGPSDSRIPRFEEEMSELSALRPALPAETEAPPLRSEQEEENGEVP